MVLMLFNCMALFDYTDIICENIIPLKPARERDGNCIFFIISSDQTKSNPV